MNLNTEPMTADILKDDLRGGHCLAVNSLASGNLTAVSPAGGDCDSARSWLPLMPTGNPPKHEFIPQIGSHKTAISCAGTPGPVYRPRLRRTAKTATAPGQGFPGCRGHTRDYRRHPSAGHQLPCQAVQG